MRTPLGVFGLGVITLGAYTVYWWIRSVRDLAELEEQSGGTAASPRIDILLASGGWGTWALLNLIQMATEQKHVAYTATGPVITTTSAIPNGLSVLLVLGLLATAVYASFRMRSRSNRVMAMLGMLPEERPGVVGHYAVSVVLGAVGAASSLQGGLNTMWERFPRWYPSIGGTKEELTAPIAAAAPQAAPVPTGPAARMVQLMPGATAGTLSAADSYEYAQAVEQVHDADAAAVWYEHVCRVDGANGRAAYWYGSWLLGRDDERGLGYLHTSMRDPAIDPYAREQAAAYLARHHRHDEAARYLPNAA
ncbi:MAG: hypothetical protein JWO69_1474 [Thermoleophilia bacterium]|nr:hypothetical protein [Thermoleophilia bacterium]